MAEDTGSKTVLRTGIFALDITVCTCTVVEKARLFYQDSSIDVAAYRTVWDHDSLTDVIIPIFVALLFIVAGLLYQSFR